MSVIRASTLGAAIACTALFVVARPFQSSAPAATAPVTPLTRLLARFGISPASQVLVYSKTSLQRARIDGENPRAIYFNDHAAVGWVPGSPLLEIAVFDGEAPGVAFLTADTSKAPGSVEEGHRCIQCHALPDSGGLPGLVMRSSGVRRGGATQCLGDIDDRTPFPQRWGGWYVTGSQLVPEHIGRERPPAFSAAYPRSSSDVVALLVLGHEVTAVNLIYRLARAWHQAQGDVTRGSTVLDQTGIRERVNALADYLLFVDEVPLPAPVAGDAEFVRHFEAGGVRDAHGHSLRTLDLRHRLFRVPCSFMIQSPAFRALPAAARRAVYERLSDILTARAELRANRPIAAADRQAIVHLLRATVGDLPAGFGQAQGTAGRVADWMTRLAPRLVAAYQ